MLSIRPEDRALALVRRGTSALWHPERLISSTYDVWRREVQIEIEKRRIRVYTGFLADSMSSRARAWTERAFGVGEGAESSPVEQWCPLYTEETRHCIEIPFHRDDGTLQLKYVFRPRFRWSVEMQATVAIVRWYRKMKMRRTNALKVAERRAASFAEPFPGYNLGRIANLRGETVGLLMSVFDGVTP